MKTIKQPVRLSDRILFGLLLGVLVYFSLEASAGATLADRTKMLGYAVLFASAFFATSLPSALIPDPRVSLHQLFNTSPAQLLRYQLHRWAPWIGSMLAPPVLIAFYDPAAPASALGPKILLFFASLISICAMGLYSFSYYYNLGPISQRWQEGSAGQWYERLIEINPLNRLPLPRGLVPALTATSRIFIVGIAVAIAQLYLARLTSEVHTLWPAVLVLAWSLFKMRRLRLQFDRAYYHTNAFYREIFQRGSLRAEEREAVRYDAVYWVPHRWRSHAWMNLVQLDRVLPIGRFFAIGLLVLAILIWRGAEPVYVTTYLLLFIASKNLASLVLSRHDLNPPAFQPLFQSRIDWSLTRFFINVRWTLPLFLGLAALGWLHPGFSIRAAGVWSLLDFFLSFVFAWIVTRAVAAQSPEHLYG